MAQDQQWFEDKQFWLATESAMFDSERMSLAAAEIEQLLSLTRLPRYSTVLDACCGPGRHCIELAKRGYSATGVDFVPEFIQQAKEKAAADKLNIEFVAADMRQFVRKDSFDAAISMFNSVGYSQKQDDDAAIIANMFTSLKPGGQIVIDTLGREGLALNFFKKEWDVCGDVFKLQELTILDDWSWLELKWIIIRPDSRGQFATYVRLYTGEQMKAMLSKIGFVDVKVYGTIAGTPYDHTAKHLIATGRKP